MSKIEVPFNMPGEPDFRFTLSLQSSSVEAHSLMDSGATKEDMTKILRSQVNDPRFMTTLEMHLINWKEKHR